MFGFGKKKKAEKQEEPKKKEIQEMNFDSIMNEFEESNASILKEMDDLIAECDRRIAEEQKNNNEGNKGAKTEE